MNVADVPGRAEFDASGHLKIPHEFVEVSVSDLAEADEYWFMTSEGRWMGRCVARNAQWDRTVTTRIVRLNPNLKIPPGYVPVLKADVPNPVPDDWKFCTETAVADLRFGSFEGMKDHRKLWVWARPGPELTAEKKAEEKLDAHASSDVDGRIAKLGDRIIFTGPNWSFARARTEVYEVTHVFESGKADLRSVNSSDERVLMAYATEQFRVVPPETTDRMLWDGAGNLFPPLSVEEQAKAEDQAMKELRDADGTKFEIGKKVILLSPGWTSPESVEHVFTIVSMASRRIRLRSLCGGYTRVWRNFTDTSVRCVPSRTTNRKAWYADGMRNWDEKLDGARNWDETIDGNPVTHSSDGTPINYEEPTMTEDKTTKPMTDRVIESGKSVLTCASHQAAALTAVDGVIGGARMLLDARGAEKGKVGKKARKALVALDDLLEDELVDAGIRTLISALILLGSLAATKEDPNGTISIPFLPNAVGSFGLNTAEAGAIGNLAMLERQIGKKAFAGVMQVIGPMFTEMRKQSANNVDALADANAAIAAGKRKLRARKRKAKKTPAAAARTAERQL